MNHLQKHPCRLARLAACTALCAAAVLLAGCADLQSKPRRSAPIANPAPASEPELKGLFGVTFGTIKPEKSTYVPAKYYRGFTNVTLVAAPVSRQVYRIRATSHPDDIRSEFENTILDLQRKFGVAPAGTDISRTFSFPNGDTVEVQIHPARGSIPAGISVDAVSHKVRALNALELRSVEAIEEQAAFDAL